MINALLALACIFAFSPQYVNAKESSQILHGTLAVVMPLRNSIIVASDRKTRTAADKFFGNSCKIRIIDKNTVCVSSGMSLKGTASLDRAKLTKMFGANDLFCSIVLDARKRNKSSDSIFADLDKLSQQYREKYLAFLKSSQDWATLRTREAKDMGVETFLLHRNRKTNAYEGALFTVNLDRADVRVIRHGEMFGGRPYFTMMGKGNIVLQAIMRTDTSRMSPKFKRLISVEHWKNISIDEGIYIAADMFRVANKADREDVGETMDVCELSNEGARMIVTNLSSRELCTTKFLERGSSMSKAR